MPPEVTQRGRVTTILFNQIYTKSMKKLSLKASDLHKGEVLTRKQLKNVLGGDDGSGGSDTSGGTKSLKCCYTNPTGCSECKTFPSNANVICPEGSGGTLTSC